MRKATAQIPLLWCCIHRCLFFSFHSGAYFPLLPLPSPLFLKIMSTPRPSSFILAGKPVPARTPSSVVAAAAAAALSGISYSSSSSASRVVLDQDGNPTARKMVAAFMVRGVKIQGPTRPVACDEMPAVPVVGVLPVETAIAQRSHYMWSTKDARCTYCFEKADSVTDLNRCDCALPKGDKRDDPAEACQEHVCSDCCVSNNDFACVYGIGDGICSCKGGHGNDDECEAFNEFLGWDGEPLNMDTEFIACKRCTDEDEVLHPRCFVCDYNGDNFRYKHGGTAYVHRAFKSPYHEAVSRRLVLLDFSKTHEITRTSSALRDVNADLFEVEDTFDGVEYKDMYCFACFSCYFRFELQGAKHKDYKQVSGVNADFAPLDLETLRTKDGKIVPCGIWQHADDVSVSLETGTAASSSPSAAGKKAVLDSASGASPTIAASAAAVAAASSSSACAGGMTKKEVKEIEGSSSASATGCVSSSSVRVQGGVPPPDLPVVWQTLCFPAGTRISHLSTAATHAKRVHTTKYRPEVPTDSEHGGDFYRDGCGYLMVTNPSNMFCGACNKCADDVTTQQINRGVYERVDSTFHSYKRDCPAQTAPFSDSEAEEDSDDEMEGEEESQDLMVCVRCFITAHDEAWEDCDICVKCDNRICFDCVQKEADNTDLLCFWCQEDKGENMREVVLVGNPSTLPAVKLDLPYTGVWPPAWLPITEVPTSDQEWAKTADSGLLDMGDLTVNVPNKHKRTRAAASGEGLPIAIPASPVRGPPVDKRFATPKKKQRVRKCPGAPERPKRE